MSELLSQLRKPEKPKYCIQNTNKQFSLLQKLKITKESLQLDYAVCTLRIRYLIFKKILINFLIYPRVIQLFLSIDCARRLEWHHLSVSPWMILNGPAGLEMKIVYFKRKYCSPARLAMGYSSSKTNVLLLVEWQPFPPTRNFRPQE